MMGTMNNHPTQVIPPLSGIAIVFGLLFIGLCGIVGSVFGSGVIGAVVGLAIVLAVVASLRSAIKRADRRHGRVRR